MSSNDRDCLERRRLTQLYLSAVRDYNQLAGKQLRAMIEGGGVSPEALEESRERRARAKSALFAHLSRHGCTARG